MALIAASQIFSGVSKSGSPALSEMTLRPERANSRALADMARVAEGLTRFKVSDSEKAVILDPQYMDDDDRRRQDIHDLANGISSGA